MTAEAAKKRTTGRFEAQLELLMQMRMTETFEPLDTLTVSVDLVNNSDRFFELCE